MISQVRGCVVWWSQVRSQEDRSQDRRAALHCGSALRDSLAVVSRFRSICVLGADPAVDARVIAHVAHMLRHEYP